VDLEKLIGAKRAGATNIYVPSRNKYDVLELDDELKEGLNIIYVNDYNDIFKSIFGG